MATLATNTAVEGLTTSIQSLLHKMDAQDKNALACHQNALITHDEQAPLCPLHDIRTGLPIANFPPTERALKELGKSSPIFTK